MSWDPRTVLKVYNYVNDEKRAKVNIKFLALFAAFVVAAVALVAFSQYASKATSPGAPESRTEYVGLSPSEIATQAVTPAAVEAKMAAWNADHPGANVQHIEPVYDHGVLVGYDVTYVPG